MADFAHNIVRLGVGPVIEERWIVSMDQSIVVCIGQIEVFCNLNTGDYYLYSIQLLLIHLFFVFRIE